MKKRKKNSFHLKLYFQAKQTKVKLINSQLNTNTNTTYKILLSKPSKRYGRIFSLNRQILFIPNQELTNLRFFFSYEKSLSIQSYQNPLYIRIITLSQL